MKRVALYERVSTLEQKNRGLSIDSQEDALIKYAKENGYKVVGIYNDAGISGHISYKKRPELQRLARDCKEGKVDLILVTKLDRFFRSVPDYYSFMEDTNQTPWKCIWEDLETDTSSGRLKMNIVLSVSQSESERISDRVTAAHRYRREQGAYVGSAPTGYKIAKKDGKTTLIKDEETKDMVECFFDCYLRSFSVKEATVKCQEKGYKLNHRTARRLATNHSYTGKYQNATYEPYISEEQWSEILRQRKIRGIYRPDRKNTFIFSGLCKCKMCGGTMLAYTNNKMPGKLMYRCTHTKSKVKIDHYNRVYEYDIEKLLLNRLDAIIGQFAIEYDIESKNTDFEREKEHINGKLSRLKFLYEEGDILVDEYKMRRDELKERLEEISSIPKREIHEMPKGWKNIYEDLDAEHKKSFWRSIIDRIDVEYGEQHDDARFKVYIR